MREKGRRGKKDGRRKGKEFMDAALDAYIRYLALQKWREVTDLQASLDIDTPQAVHQAGLFPERGVYREIWERWWQQEVLSQLTTAPSLFGCIETAVRGALQEEKEARVQQGDVSVEDTLDYKHFIDYALDSLFEEEAGTIEEI